MTFTDAVYDQMQRKRRYLSWTTKEACRPSV